MLLQPKRHTGILTVARTALHTSRKHYFNDSQPEAESAVEEPHKLFQLMFSITNRRT